VLALNVGNRLYEDACGQLGGCGCGGLFSFRHFGGRLRCLGSEFFAEGLGGNIVDRAGSALHLEATTFKELHELLVFHSDIFGKLVYSNTHK
jgi:hypothetical protein